MRTKFVRWFYFGLPVACLLIFASCTTGNGGSSSGNSGGTGNILIAGQAPTPAPSSGACTATSGVVAVQAGACSTSPSPSIGAAANPTSCPGLNTPTGTQQTVAVTTFTFYGAPDNSPPGYQQTGISGNKDGGDGTYCDPTDFAIGQDEINGMFAGAIRIYVGDPYDRYFARNDSCAECRGTHLDLYVGGNSASDNGQDVINCENGLPPPTPSQVILYPPPGLTVKNPGPIYSGSCPKL